MQIWQGDTADGEDRANKEHRDRSNKLQHKDTTGFKDTGDTRQETRQGAWNTGEALRQNQRIRKLQKI